MLKFAYITKKSFNQFLNILTPMTSNWEVSVTLLLTIKGKKNMLIKVNKLNKRLLKAIKTKAG